MAEPRRDSGVDDSVDPTLGEHLEDRMAEVLRPELEDFERQAASAGARPETDEPPAAAEAKPQTTDKDFFRALGGWGALLDIGLPWIAFLIVYGVSDHDLQLALIVAIACAAAVAALRLIRRQPLRNVLGGFIGVLISAWVANRSGRAEDVYLPGLLTNLGYGLLYGLTVVFRWPLFGVIYGLVTQTGTAWRKDPAMLRGFTRATAVFAGLFVVRLLVQVPLYLTGSLNALGIAKVGMGLPLYALALWLAYAVLRGSLPPEKWDEARDHVTHLLRGGKK
ncbi:uncharacterized protein DUF3159 [Kribbella amoyensis]|uniref:Uncharacterized protein DUF3159 n=1 Tax=Kribbella amoyensis TaxID=996641 RepID=A0A561BY59_9ACTN|nr:DUF3159 domain-containing protein [Kribbella amoyensis]TWD83825.1 uncharacterized protein DUF3159 [Kribbella amoyensis]